MLVVARPAGGVGPRLRNRLPEELSDVAAASVVSDVTMKGKQFKDVKFNFPKGNEDAEDKKKDDGGGMGK